MIKNDVNFSKLTKIVKQEEAKWKYGKLNEMLPEAYPMLKVYWSNLGINQTQEQMSNKTHQNKWPWSAAYVSYVMTKVDSTFPKSSAHRNYFLKAKENRNKNSSFSYKTFSLSREKEPILAQVGDVLGKTRGNKNNGNTEEKKKSLYNATHSDVVYEIVGKIAKLSGGNLGNSNKTNISISLNSDGSYPKNPNNYIVVIKKR